MLIYKLISQLKYSKRCRSISPSSVSETEPTPYHSFLVVRSLVYLPEPLLHLIIDNLSPIPGNRPVDLSRLARCSHKFRRLTQLRLTSANREWCRQKAPPTITLRPQPSPPINEWPPPLVL